ncbi:hypothetical protein NITHO_1260004 [Nitrolancea hollandica Lb]|uniref:Uncharacterized protein n=1 Tax=Nitrolancea hollandica Lb TaxID=1129897 RepID=I4ECV9_9BACT|nr:hypothetical protein NITHO_1260004 [Nitrolancea hollandica Lb]
MSIRERHFPAYIARVNTAGALSVLITLIRSETKRVPEVECIPLLYSIAAARASRS